MNKYKRTIGILIMLFGFTCTVLLGVFFDEKLKSRGLLCSLVVYLFYSSIGGGIEIANGNYKLNAKLIFKFFNGILATIVVFAVYHGVYYLLVINTGWYNEVWSVIARIISFCISGIASLYTYCLYRGNKEHDRITKEINEENLS